MLVNDVFIPTSMIFTESKDWGRISVDVNLTSGENTIILSNGNGKDIEIDAMVIRKAN